MRATNAFFLDLASEEIACSTGMLLTDQNLKDIASRHGVSDFLELERSETETVFRPEDFETAILETRVAIGNLPDAKMGQFVLMDTVIDLENKGVDAMSICQAYLKASESYKPGDSTYNAILETISLSNASPKHVATILRAIGEMQSRKVNFIYRRVRQKGWDGAVSLNQLFDGESIPTDPDVYFDQRYIDFLAKNGEDMTRMHWRNFERLTTEYFHREGHEVDLGAGTKDGGIDVRVWPNKESRSGPPLILVQCKRYKDEVIGIETVKAFWADVHFHGAEKGIIATTSHVSRDSKKLCDVRKWPMSFAESDEVKRWAQTLWRHAPKLSKQ